MFILLLQASGILPGLEIRPEIGREFRNQDEKELYSCRNRMHVIFDCTLIPAEKAPASTARSRGFAI
jgi:hypothetical protein